MIEQRQDLSEATATVNKLALDPEYDTFHDYLKRAKAVLIVPSLYKGAFIVGGEYGDAILMVRTSTMAGSNNVAPAYTPPAQNNAPIAQPAPLQPIQTEQLGPQTSLTTGWAAHALILNGGGSWGVPLFYKVTGVSAGLQIGGESSELIFTIMTDKALKSIFSNSMKLGADVSVAVGPVGKGLQAATAAKLPNADMYAFGKAAGLYGGVSLSGALVQEKTADNLLVYGSNTKPQELIYRTNSPLAEGTELQQALQRAEAGRR